MLNAQIGRFQTVFLIALGLFFLMAGVEAQIDRAALTGIVTNPSDAVIPKARIKCVSESTGLRHRDDEQIARVVCRRFDLPIDPQEVDL
jgi:hypothetical protein